MSGYVSKEEVKSLFGGCVAEEYPSICKAVHKAIDCIPNADVRENVHGEWIEVTDYKDDNEYRWHIICSVCRHRGMFEDDNFCPNCGADMRGE